MGGLNYIFGGGLQRDVKRIIAMIIALHTQQTEGFKMTVTQADIDNLLTQLEAGEATVEAGFKALAASQEKTQADVETLAKQITAQAPDLAPEAARIQAQVDAQTRLASLLSNAVAADGATDSEATSAATPPPATPAS